jgi:hypothetical protein
MLLLFRHAWLLFIVVTCVNGFVWWRRAQPRIAQDPVVEDEYRTLIRSWVVYGNLPWLVMGAGILFGGVPSTFSYFNPRNGPFVIAFYATVVTLWIATFWWLFFKGGVETLISHPGLFNIPGDRPWVLKAYFLLCLAGGIVGLGMMVFGNIQVPDLR